MRHVAQPCPNSPESLRNSHSCRNQAPGRAGFGASFNGSPWRRFVVIGACTLLAFAARGHWRLELMSHFRAQYFWMLALAAILLAVARRPRPAWIAAALSAVNLVLIVPLYFGPATVADRPVSRGMSLNVYFHNRDYDRTLELIRREDPDFVLLLEVTPDWAEAMRGLGKHVSARTSRAAQGLRRDGAVQPCADRRPGGAPARRLWPIDHPGSTGSTQRYADLDRGAYVIAQDSPELHGPQPRTSELGKLASSRPAR